jgi:hypothetical protein
MQAGLLDNAIVQYVVCRSPADYPGMFTCRRHFIVRGGQIYVDQHVHVTPHLIGIRRPLIRAGLHRLPRYPDDNPVILEVWL